MEGTAQGSAVICKEQCGTRHFFQHRASAAILGRFRQPFAASAMPASRPGGLEPGKRPHLDDVPFKLSYGCKDVEGELPDRSGGINPVLQALELGAFGVAAC